MKTIRSMIVCLTVYLVAVGFPDPSALAQQAARDPLITLSFKDAPLGEVLDTITAETGYQFKLNSQWQDWPVSATIGNLPLEKGLKRILRSLNYTIIWESERTVSIMVYGKAEPGGRGAAVSFAAPPQVEQVMPTPDIETEAPATEEEPEAGTDQSTADKALDQEPSATPAVAPPMEQTEMHSPPLERPQPSVAGEPPVGKTIKKKPVSQ